MTDRRIARALRNGLIGALLMGTTAALAAPFPIFNDNGGKRDPLQHLLYLAENGKTPAQRGELYANLAEKLTLTGRPAEAMRATEAAAIEGDLDSALKVLAASKAGRYKLHYFDKIVDAALLSHAKAGGVGAALLLADLLASGRIDGGQYGSATYWLEKAADAGSNTALRRLARAAEYRGEINLAANYYARADQTLSRLDRALKEAKDIYLGNDTKRSVSVAFAWLAYASRLSLDETGKAAAKLYRKAINEDDRTKLLAMAKAAGIEPESGGGFTAQLAAATTDEQRAKILAAMKAAADSGSPEAAADYWRALKDTGGSIDAAVPYLLIAVGGGNPTAIEDTSEFLARTGPDDAKVASMLGALEQSAASNNVEALKALGSLYAIGGPVIADPTRSTDYYRRAADAGDVDSQLRIGLYFAQQDGAPDTLTLARHYLSAAADKGSASAKAYLATLPAA